MTRDWDTLVADDRVLCEVTCRGTHDGELARPTGSVGSSGTKATTRCAQAFRVRDGLLTDMRNYFDLLNMLEARDAIPTAAGQSA